MKHEFAFHIPVITEGTCELFDEQLCHRVLHVLRLTKGDVCTLFNHDVHAVAMIDEISKKRIIFNVSKLVTNQNIKPCIIFFLPLLKRENLEQAVYGLTELGVNEIRLIQTEKSKQDLSKKIFERLEKIIIAAAEQSKNFSFPLLKVPVSLNEGLHVPERSIFFDPAGEPTRIVLEQLDRCVEPIGLFIGPEGDLSSKEKGLLRQQDVLFCALTPTVLRAFQAAIVGTGIIRSLVK